ncbi:MAG: hypothetical protein KJZ65_07460 [Phycisphaerales bacterium]|nr:hypothetical protein [Phycisphaerales bacterium]
MDRLFDREMSKEEQDRLALDLERAPEALAMFRDTTNILLALRKPVSTPDLTDAVLSRLPVRQRMARGRRRLSPGRVAVAAAVLLAGVGLALLQHPGRPRTTPMSVRSIELDPVLARLFDRQLAELEVASLGMEKGEATPRVALIHQRATLNAPPIVFELSPVQSRAGAGDTATTYAPHLQALEDDFKNWLASNGLTLPGLEGSIGNEAPRVLGPRMREPNLPPILIGMQNPEHWLLAPQSPPRTPDRMLLWPEALELRLDLSEARRSTTNLNQ